jgi:ketosteroid isomerase-like protein
MMADDAIEMPPDGPALVGRDAIVQAMTDYFNEFTATQTATTDEVSVHGDLAVMHGTWTVTEEPKAGGESQTRSGKWLEVLRRQADGSWKTWRWMWNQQSAMDAT